MNAFPHLLICVSAQDAEDLQVLKVYRRLADDGAEPPGFFRVIDDSGEDYLYPRVLFRELPLPPALKEELEGLLVGLAEPQHVGYRRSLPPDPVIDEIREVRRQTSARFEHDPERIMEHYLEVQRKYADRVVGMKADPEDPALQVRSGE